MRRSISVSALIFILVFTSLACSFGTPRPEDTPTPDTSATEAVLQMQQETQDAARQATSEVKQTAEAQAQKATAAFSKTEAAQKRATQKVASAQTATASVIEAATEQASDFYGTITQLYEDNVITTTEGQYYRLDDFDQSWAQINWYQWWTTGLEPTNFVIRADAAWESASNTANFFTSGCGFVYAENGQDNHYATFLALDGNVHTFRVKNGIGAEMKGGYYGPMETPDGNAQILLAVDNQFVTVFVNGKKVVRFQDQSLGEGNLGLTLFSGTNKDYGTRCIMTNVEVWELP